MAQKKNKKKAPPVNPASIAKASQEREKKFQDFHNKLNADLKEQREEEHLKFLINNALTRTECDQLISVFTKQKQNHYNELEKLNKKISAVEKKKKSLPASVK